MLRFTMPWSSREKRADVQRVVRGIGVSVSNRVVVPQRVERGLNLHDPVAAIAKAPLATSVIHSDEEVQESLIIVQVHDGRELEVAARVADRCNSQSIELCAVPVEQEYVVARCGVYRGGKE